MSKLTSALQSRLSKRGEFLADLEDEYNIAKMFRSFALFDGELDIARGFSEEGRTLRAEIKAVAEDQLLDRKILRQLHTYETAKARLARRLTPL